MRLDDIMGHDRIKRVLAKISADGRVGHAYIFEGMRGVGRMTTAQAFAQLLVCENPTGGTACGECRSCRMAESGSHPDIRIITNQLYDSDKKSSDILVDTVRNMKREIYIKPYAAERKIYIVPKADTMNNHAQNSLLKVLEEPPEYCTIILIAENSNMFLPTILSRAVILNFEPLEKELVRNYLLQKYPDITAQDANVKAGMSQGSIGRAAELAEDIEADELRKDVLHAVMNIAYGGRRGLYDAVLFFKRNKKSVDFIMNVLKSLINDLLYNDGLNRSRTVNTDNLQNIDKLSEKIPPSAAVCMLETVLKYEDYLDKNLSYPLTMQCMATELWEAINDRGYRSKI